MSPAASFAVRFPAPLRPNLNSTRRPSSTGYVYSAFSSTGEKEKRTYSSAATMPVSNADPLPPGFDTIPVFKPGVSIANASDGVLGPKGVRAFRHVASGVRLIVFDAPGPLVSATMVVNTMPISDAGHPHTLEHIIFLGSKKHPRRGYLDNLACRCLADGTNAWTDSEFTAYTTTTAGLDGMLQLLPVYLDHVLRPVINAASFASEVYHVRKDGKEAGVVFCEMQARENTEADMVDREFRAALLSGTPIALEAGGICGDIRKLTNEDIARFHRDQYCGANVTIVIGGSNIASNSLLRSVQGLLDDISSQPGYQPGRPQWVRPLDITPLKPVTQKVVRFPCPDETIGSIMIGWRGPCATDRLGKTAVEILLRYLSNDVWSPVRQMFVEIEEQKASDAFFFQEPYFELSTFGLSLSGIEHKEEEDSDDEDEGEECEDEGEQAQDGNGNDAMDVEDENGEQDSYLLSGKIQEELMTFLKKVVETKELPGGIGSIHAAIKKDREYHITQLESDIHEAVPYHLMEEIVYAHRGGLVVGEEVRGSLAIYDDLHEKDEAFWLDLLRTQLVEAPRVEIIAVPDASLAEKNAASEKKALTDRVAQMGKEALEKIGAENEERIASLKPGEFTAEEFPPMPSAMNIARWPYKVEREIRPGYIAQSVTLETAFVHCTIMLDTKSMNLSQRMLMPVLCELISTCDILLEDGSYISYTDNARALSQASVSTDRSGVMLGTGNNMAHQCVIIHFAAEPDSFAEAAEIILQTMFQSEVTAERLSSVSQTLIANSTEEMRDASSVLLSSAIVMPFVVAAENNVSVELPNYALSNFVGAHPLLTFFNDEFTRAKPRKQLRRAMLRKLHDTLGLLRNLPASDVFIQVTGRDPKPAHETLSNLWAEKRAKFAPDAPKAPPAAAQAAAGATLPLTRRLSHTLPSLLGERSVERIIGIAGVDSCFLQVGVHSPVHKGHADWGALSVLCEMVNRMEGPLSDAVRGAGLAYGVSLSNAPWSGMLHLEVDESSSPAAAWDAACGALQAFRAQLGDGNGAETGGSGGGALAVDLDTAKAATLFVLHRARSTPEAIAAGALSQAAIGAPASPLADQMLEEAVEKVALGDVAAAFDRHVARLFARVDSRLVVVTCGDGATRETVEAFEACRWPLKLRECRVEELHPREVKEYVRKFK